ncbi:MAG: GMP synthase (glutamine-hydrolyzing) [Firmicutes bacterium HGW-Firmicutes-9]|jgi:GMP synthase (glutamine-hydrolysing)|nr:MAG: GMP synthase (glutamine-hydrolyzing) [Firmicutes bacterium HGW-Firmicutes-9]
MRERVVVLDFGGQYNQLIARRVREAGVYSELIPHDASLERIKGDSLSAIIMTGGPDSAYEEGAKACDNAVFSLGVPVLGICYGMQYIAKVFGGEIAAAPIREYGHTKIVYQHHPLLASVGDVVWMNHNDSVTRAPAGFRSIASTKDCPVAAFANDDMKIYGIQFHAEVTHTKDGHWLFKNFLKNICGLECDYSAANLKDELIASIRAQVGDKRVIGALSGGVDSSVASVLVHEAVGSQMTCIFVDHGLLRENEAEQVMQVYHDTLSLNIIKVDARERFLSKLAGVVEPEKKRKIIGEEFIRVFEEESKKLGGGEFLLQGTIYPDVIESGTSSASTIKSHHNVGGLPKDIGFIGLVEPLRMLFKDEVRALGESLGIPHELVWRQPFPGPGLAIRVLGDVTEDKLAILRRSDAIFREEVKNAGLQEAIWQYFTVFTGMRTVGVMGDQRTYDYIIGVRAVTSTDAMTVEWAEIPYPVLRRISERIIGEVPHVNRVVYDITSKPPGTIEWE